MVESITSTVISSFKPIIFREFLPITQVKVLLKLVNATTSPAEGDAGNVRVNDAVNTYKVLITALVFVLITEGVSPPPPPPPVPAGPVAPVRPVKPVEPDAPCVPNPVEPDAP